MTSFTWKSGINGDWGNKADWNPGTIPNGTGADVTIAATGKYYVLISAGESFTADSVTLNDATATLDLSGYLGLAGTTDELLISAGEVNLSSGGEIAGGTINASTGTFLAAGGTLFGVDYEGVLNLTSANAYLYIGGTDNFMGAGGSGLGTINLTGANAYLYAEDSTTLNNVLLNFGHSGSSDTIFLYPNQSATTTLTLGAATTISQTAAASTDYIYYYASAGTLINEGTINAASKGGSFNIAEYYGQQNVFLNQGSIAVSNGDDLILSNITTFANSGMLAIGANETFDLNVMTFSNTGSITVGAGGTFDVQGSIAIATLGSLSLASTATFEVDGTLDLGGGTLDVKAGTDFGHVSVNSGTLENGFIAASDGGTLTLSDAVLSDITYSGTLNVSGYFGGVYVENGLTASGGVINLTDPTYGFEQLVFRDSETLSNQTIVVGEINDGYGGGTIYSQYGTLTLGAKTEILQAATTTNGGEITGNVVNDGLISVAAGQFNVVSSYDYVTGQNDDNFVNNGVIAISGSGAQLIVSTPSFDSTGLITVASGDTFVISTSNFTNTGQISLASGSELEVQDASLALGQLGSIVNGTGVLIDFGSAATLNLGGGTLDVNSGVFANVEVNGGTLENGFVAASDGGTLTLSDAVLSDITYSGTLNVSGYFGGVYVENGLTASGGVINLTDPTYGFEQLVFRDSETLSNQTIVVGEINDGYGGGTIYSQYGTLTLGAKTEILQAATTTNGGEITGNIVNDGLISVAAGQFNIFSSYDYVTGQYDDNFVNAATGTIAISDSDVVIGTPSFYNAGLITVTSGGAFVISTPNFTNAGKISLASGSELEVQYGSLALGQLSSIVTGPGALIDIDYAGTLNLGGGTLDVNTSGVFANVEVNSGTLENGFLAASDGGTLFLGQATLSNITYSGTLNISGYDNSLYVENGLTANGGVINLTDPTSGYESLRFLDSETFSNQTIVVGEINDGYGGGTIYSQYGTLTLGAQTEILQAATTTNGGEITGNIVNDGLISVAAGQFNIFSSYDYVKGQYDDNFVNAATGTIAISGGAQLIVGTPTFTNTGLIEGTGVGTASINVAVTTFKGFTNGTLTTGAFEATAGDTLALSLASVITTDDSNLILSGPGSEIQSYKNATGKFVSLESSLVTIGTGGTLNVLGGRGYTTAGSLTIGAGTLDLGGGTFTATTLSLTTATSHIVGFGTVKDAVANAGTIFASGGNLDITGAITGAGALLIGQSATLELGGATAESVTFAGAAATHSTLKLDAPTSFTGTLAGLAVGDVIDIGGTSVSATSLSGTSLLITLSSGGTLSETLSSALPTNERFGISGDGGSGSDLTLYQEASASLAPATLALGQAHVGGTVVSDLTIANTQMPGYSEGLDASFSSAGAGITASGSITTLAAGATNSTSLQITLNTATAGSIASSAVVTLASDGAGTDGQSPLSLGSQTVAVTGSVFNYATASAVAPTPISFGQQHVGATLSQTLTLGNAAAAGAYSENLDASFSGTSGSVTDSGAVSELAAGATSTSALAVSLNSGTAGVASGTATLALTSDGSTIDTLGTTALAPETVTASGTLFNYATASTVAPVNFGIVHVGQTAVSQTVVLNNTAAPGLYSENLDGSFSGTSASITTTGTVSELAAGSGSGTSLAIGLKTSTNGVISGFTTLNVTSDGAGIDSLGTTVLAPETIAVTGTVDNYATVGVSLISGPGKLGGGAGGVFTLNLGSVVLGSAAPAESIGIENTAKGQADLLKGTLALSGTTSAFTNNSAISFTGVAAGSDSTGHTISLHTGAVGTFTETIVLSPTGYNASGYAGTLTPDTLVVTGTVTAAATVPAMQFAAPAATPLAATAGTTPLTGGAAWLSVPALQAGLAGPAALFGASPLSTAATEPLSNSLATTALAGFVLPGLQNNDNTKLHVVASTHVMLWGAG